MGTRVPANTGVPPITSGEQAMIAWSMLMPYRPGCRAARTAPEGPARAPGPGPRGRRADDADGSAKPPPRTRHPTRPGHRVCVRLPGHQLHRLPGPVPGAELGDE